MALPSGRGAAVATRRGVPQRTKEGALRVTGYPSPVLGRAHGVLHAAKAVAVGSARGAFRGALAALAVLALTGLSMVMLGVARLDAGDVQSAPAGLAGQLLVATPEMPDPRFSKTVIYMVEHSTAGAMGLVVNKTMGDIPISKLLEGLGLDGDGVRGKIRLHRGGPVNATSGLVLHSPDYVADGTVVVDHGLALTAQPEIVADIASGAGPRHSIVAFGYAGWAPGQLENEIAAGVWITIPPDDALVFDDDDEKWRRAMARWGVDL